ncbi:MAG TPA: hypothetical protein VKH44_00615 [Pirellulaceae bacterium]|nr:hypothetical protein [Pirellulaceae bacterium]
MKPLHDDEQDAVPGADHGAEDEGTALAGPCQHSASQQAKSLEGLAEHQAEESGPHIFGAVVTRRHQPGRQQLSQTVVKALSEQQADQNAAPLRVLALVAACPRVFNHLRARPGLER